MRPIVLFKKKECWHADPVFVEHATFFKLACAGMRSVGSVFLISVDFGFSRGGVVEHSSGEVAWSTPPVAGCRSQCSPRCLQLVRATPLHLGFEMDSKRGGETTPGVVDKSAADVLLPGGVVEHFSGEVGSMTPAGGGVAPSAPRLV